MILVFGIIVVDLLSVMKLVWRENNASTNFRGGKMLDINSVLLGVPLMLRYCVSIAVILDFWLGS